VLLPPGTFRMGAHNAGAELVDLDAEANESPVQAVTLDAFFLAKHEMTQAQ
jgi:formylglycine-generating enzyme required for sulfatase activity